MFSTAASARRWIDARVKNGELRKNMPAGRGRCARPAELVKKVFLTSSQTRPTSLGSRLKRLRLAAAHSLTLARLRAEFAIDRQENMRFCRAEMPSYGVKDLENTQSILCGLFLVCEHFSSGRTASHRTALDFRGIFVLLDAGGLSPAKDKRAKSTEKTGCPTCVLLLIDASENT